MNTKRQTVWLVSMLSLMVVLSAYYLFSDRTDNVDTLSDSILGEEITMDMTQLTIDDLDKEWETAGKTNEEILKEMEAQTVSGGDYFSLMKLDRLDSYAKEWENLMNVINSTENTETMQQAYEQLDQLEQMDTKIESMESELMRNFSDVLIEEKDGQWNVLVLTDQLETSQAVSIIDMVVNEMNVKPSAVQVQVKTPYK